MARILLLEDMGAFRRMIALVLSEDGHEVTQGIDGAAALDPDLLAQTDLLISDIDMPNVNGIEAMKAARATHPEIKIIAMSGGGQLDGSDYLKTCMDLGVSKIMLKPFEPDNLAAEVRRVLGVST